MTASTQPKATTPNKVVPLNPASPSGRLAPYPDAPYQVITGDRALRSICRKLATAKRLACDTETTGLDPHIARVCLIQLAAPGLPVYVIDLSKIRDITPLKRLLEQSKALKLFHHLQFDYQMLLSLGIRMRGPFFDTEIAYRLLFAGIKIKATLQIAVAKFLHLQLDKAQQLSDFSRPLTPSQLQYAANDADALLRLFSVLAKRLKQEELAEIAKIEFAAIPATAQMEYNGIKLDADFWHQARQSLVAERDSHLATLRSLPLPRQQLSLFAQDGNGLNPDSPKQLLQALQFNGVNVTGTSKKDLVPIAHTHPVLQAILEYRGLHRMLKLFDEKLPAAVHATTGRLHPRYYQLGARSGRYTCRNPELQCVPKCAAARRAFTAAPGNVLITADYSQIEMRIAAKITGDRHLCEAYQRGDDIHLLTASLVSGRSLSELLSLKASNRAEYDRLRGMAKPINFGLIFGISAAGLQISAKLKYGIDMSLAEAKQFRQRFFEYYEGIAAWHEQVFHSKFRKGNWFTRTLAGRRRLWTEQPKLNALYNSPIQGSSADITKLALGKLAQVLPSEVLIVASVHDEIIVECPTAMASKVAKLVKRIMMEAGDRFLSPIPCEVDVKVGETWGGAIAA